jgi:hypothetical protein
MTLPVLLLLLVGCPQTTPADDDFAEPTPEPTPEPVFDTLSGTIDYRKEYQSGALQGQICTELFSLAGPNVTDTQPHDCETCEVVYQFYSTPIDNSCAGDSEIRDEGLVAFDLREEAGEAVIWIFVEGWFSSEWSEFGTGALDYDTVSFSWDDPDNGSWAGNVHLGDPCGLTEPCTWNGYYDFVFDLGTNEVAR